MASAQSGLPQALMEASNADRQRVAAVVRNALVSGIHAVLLAAVIGGLLTGLGVLATALRGLCAGQLGRHGDVAVQLDPSALRSASARRSRSA